MTNNLIIDIPVRSIKPETVALNREKILKNSLIHEKKPKKMWQPVTVREIEHEEYQYEIVDGRRRTETIRAFNENETVRAIVENLDNKDSHIVALVKNSGRPNYADEAEHVFYLHTKEKMTLEQIAVECNQKLNVIKERLKIKQKTSTIVFQALKEGLITYSTACTLSKLPKDKQTRVYKKHLTDDKAISTKEANKEVKKQKAKNVNQLFTEFSENDIIQETVEMVTLTAQMMENIINDKIVEVSWNGQKIMLCRCE